MNPLAKNILQQSLALNQVVSQVVSNGTDWLFKRDTLIKSGRTWFELVHDTDLMAVRYYGLPDQEEIELTDGSTMPIERTQYDVPLVFIPPLGVSTESFDLMPQRSIVKYFAACGFKTYLIDWGVPEKRHAHLNLSDYSGEMLNVALEKIRQHSGVQPVSLMGWCMGGLLALLHQGQALDANIRNIVTVASPIDLSSGVGFISGAAEAINALNGPAKLVSNLTNFRLNSLDPERFGTPWWMTTLIFKATDPLSSITTYWDLVTNLADREFVESHSTRNNYLNNMLRYPGGVLKDMLTHVVQSNELAKGTVTLEKKAAELSRIESNLLVFAGKWDSLVPPEVAKTIVDVVASKDKEFHIAPGGHMGVMIGSKAQKEVWGYSANWLAKRSVLS